MILKQLFVIFFNLLFGMFFCLVLRIIELLTHKKIYWIASFLTTILIGIIYIIAMEKFPPNFYNLVFLTFGFGITYKLNYFKLDSYILKLKLISIFLKKFLIKVLLFTINYSLIVKIIEKIKKKTNASLSSKKNML